MLDKYLTIDNLPWANKAKTNTNTIKKLLNVACQLSSHIAMRYENAPEEVADVINFCVAYSNGTALNQCHIDAMEQVANAALTIAAHRSEKKAAILRKNAEQLPPEEQKKQRSQRKWEMYRQTQTLRLVAKLVEMTSQINQNKREEALETFDLDILQSAPITLLRLENDQEINRDDLAKSMSKYRDRIWAMIR